jgi:hypothetical protein
MSDITISRPTQGVLLLAVVGVVVAVIARQLPELQRYLNIRSM